MSDVTPLFRDRAVSGKDHRLPGPVSVIAPPAFPHILVAALLSLGLLAVAFYLIEIPLRTRAVGVLMPPGGVLNIASTTHGRVEGIAVVEGQIVVAGQLLIELSSDSGSAEVPSLAAAELGSLESELEILARKRRQDETLYEVAADDAAVRVESLSRRRDLALKELDVAAKRIRLLAGRVDRMERLADQGGIAPDRLAQISAEHLAAQREQLGARRAIVELDLELQQMVSSGRKSEMEGVILNLESDAKRERLERQRKIVAVERRQQIIAPRGGRIIRVGVKSGEVIAQGHRLLTLAADDSNWEAWMYVSARDAGLLQEGQEIELRLDAYPHQLFGTVAAAVSSVTRLAVLPNEVRAPVAIAGAVFEVRARITQPIVDSLHADFLPGIGASFTADIIKHRYRLYEWLSRGQSSLDRRAVIPDAPDLPQISSQSEMDGAR